MGSYIYRCATCGKTYSSNEVRYLCPDCSPDAIPEAPFKGILWVEYPYEELSKKDDLSIWDDLMPLDLEPYHRLAIGNTPFQETPLLAESTQLSSVWVKNDSLNPSGSLKDRASLLVAIHAKTCGIDTVVTASTGNAACALASVCAGLGMKAVIFVPATAPKAKLTQIRLYGATIIPVDGTYDDACRLSLEYKQTHPGMNRNTAFHPFTIEGKKTVGFEIFEQNGGIAPDTIFVSVGDGVILTGVYKAFLDLLRVGLIKKLPRIYGIQAESSDAIHHLWSTGSFKPASNPNTVADSISVSYPSAAYTAVEAIQMTQGECLLVSDKEIMKAQQILANKTGIYAEPAAATAMAGMDKAVRLGLIKKAEQHVLLVTGNGLKDVDATIRFEKEI